MGNAMTSFKKAFDKFFGNKEMRVRHMNRASFLPPPRVVLSPKRTRSQVDSGSSLTMSGG